MMIMVIYLSVNCKESLLIDILIDVTPTLKHIYFKKNSLPSTTTWEGDFE